MLQLGKLHRFTKDFWERSVIFTSPLLYSIKYANPQSIRHNLCATRNTSQTGSKLRHQLSPEE